MADRIDHADEAREWLRDAPIEQHEHNDLSRAALCIGMAQAEATLALVEQQRIANLLRLHAEYGHTETALFIPVGSASMALHPDIAAALGIGDMK